MSQKLLFLLEQEDWETLELKQEEFSSALMELPIVEIAKSSEYDLHCLQTIMKNNDYILERSLAHRSVIAQDIIKSKQNRKAVKAYQAFGY